MGDQSIIFYIKNDVVWGLYRNKNTSRTQLAKNHQLDSETLRVNQSLNWFIASFNNINIEQHAQNNNNCMTASMMYSNISCPMRYVQMKTTSKINTATINVFSATEYLYIPSVVVSGVTSGVTSDRCDNSRGRSILLFGKL